VHASLGINAHAESLIHDHLDQGPHEGLRLIGLVHAFDRAPQVVGGFFRPLSLLRAFQVTLSFLVGGREFEPLVSLGDLLDRFPVARVSDQDAQVRNTSELAGDSLQPGKKEIADGKLGGLGASQDAVDVIGQFLIPVIDDVVRWHVSLFLAGPQGG
jgi:hypothetical protein